MFRMDEVIRNAYGEDIQWETGNCVKSILSVVTLAEYNAVYPA